MPKVFAPHNRIHKCSTLNLFVVDAVSGDDEDKTKSIDGKACPGNRSGIQLTSGQNYRVLGHVVSSVAVCV